MNKVAECIMSLVILVWWLAGIVLADGFWSMITAIIFPPWAWYLVIEAAMRTYHVLGA